MFIVSLLFFAYTLSSQNSEIGTKDPCFTAGDWIVMDGKSIEDKSFVLQKFDPDKHNTMMSVFSFSSDGTVHHRLHNPQRMGMCGVGLFNISSGHWSVQDSVMILSLEGGRRLESSFKFERKYNVSMITSGQWSIIRRQ